MLYIFKVPDMSCEHCKMAIKKQLQKLKIKNFEILLEEKLVKADVDDPNLIVEALDEIGYSVEDYKSV